MVDETGRAATTPEPAEAEGALPPDVELRREAQAGQERFAVWRHGKPVGGVYRRLARGKAAPSRWSLLGEEKPLYATKEQAVAVLLNRFRPRA